MTTTHQIIDSRTGKVQSRHSSEKLAKRQLRIFQFGQSTMHGRVAPVVGAEFFEIVAVAA